jgi:glucose-1-phosphate thymidylyltransferase
MKYILPIAGVGQRLRPFTFSKPKGFLKIGGNRVVDHILQKIWTSMPQKMPLAVVYGYKREQIRKYLNDRYQNQFELSYLSQTPKGYQGDVPYFGGLGEAILLTQNWYQNTPSEKSGKLEPGATLIFLGDMIPVKDYSEVIRELEQPDVDGVIGTMIVQPDKTQFYGIVETNATGTIMDLVEKPPHTTSNLAIAGVYAFREHTVRRLYEILQLQHEAFLKKEKNTKKEFQFTPALKQLVDEGFKLRFSTFDEGILDFGRPDALLSGNRVLLDANNAQLEGTIHEIQHSIVKNPCAIGEHTVIRRSIIGPYVSIGNNCVIENCNLQNVVIGDECTMSNIISTNSIIGDNVKIDSIIKNAMILGDHSFIIESKDE